MIARVQAVVIVAKVQLIEGTLQLPGHGTLNVVAAILVARFADQLLSHDEYSLDR